MTTSIRRHFPFPLSISVALLGVCSQCLPTSIRGQELSSPLTLDSAPVVVAPRITDLHGRENPDDQQAVIRFSEHADLWDTAKLRHPPAGSLPTHENPSMQRTESLVTGYDEGFYIQTVDQDTAPFRLRVNLQSQFRYTNFNPQQATWTDAGGQINPLAARNDFEINRGRLIFSGHAVDKDLNYYLNLDYATLGDDRVTILLAWMSYRFSRSLELFYGKGKVVGSREWLVTSMATQGPERTMATTFFRPSITAGVWARGEPLDRIYYQAVVGNGFNTAAIGFRDLDTNFVYSANLWHEPLGEFGLLFSDWQGSANPVLRWGGSLTTSRQSGTQFNRSEPEDSFIRLSDGTDLTTPGALAPGVTVTDYSVSLATLDAGIKYQGWSLHSEYFLRWLSDIRGTGPIPQARRNLFDHGVFILGGRFLVPQHHELYLRTSAVYGPFGSGSEWGGGWNWFIKKHPNWRCTFDIAHINRSPTEQIRTGYEAGASGFLYRLQIQTTY